MEYTVSSVYLIPDHSSTRGKDLLRLRIIRNLPGSPLLGYDRCSPWSSLCTGTPQRQGRLCRWRMR